MFFSSRKLRSIFLFLVLIISHITQCGFIAGTLVKTPGGYTPIEKLQKDDLVICCDTQNNLITIRPITNTSSTLEQQPLQLSFESQTITTKKLQKFYCPQSNKWVCAQEYEPQKILKTPTVLYHIGVSDFHNFYITHDDILVHNWFDIPLVFIFGEGVIEFCAAASFEAFGMGILATAYNGLANHFSKKRNQPTFKELQRQVTNNYPSPPMDPEDPDDEKRKRKKNTVSKTEFFKQAKDDYEYYKDGAYRRKPNSLGYGEDAEFLKWDHLHNDIEVYDKNKMHTGSLDPCSKRMYKPPVTNRLLSKK